jgi:hypothetical protein
MPAFPDEDEFLRILHGCKNKMLNNYDEAYPDMSGDNDQDNQKIQDIRKCFFNKFEPFLISAFKAINTEEKNPKRLDDYWNKDAFIEDVGDEFVVEEKDK